MQVLYSEEVLRIHLEKICFPCVNKGSLKTLALLDVYSSRAKKKEVKSELSSLLVWSKAKMHHGKSESHSPGGALFHLKISLVHYDTDVSVSLLRTAHYDSWLIFVNKRIFGKSNLRVSIPNKNPNWLKKLGFFIKKWFQVVWNVNFILFNRWMQWNINARKRCPLLWTWSINLNWWDNNLWR